MDGPSLLIRKVTPMSSTDTPTLAYQSVPLDPEALPTGWRVPKMLLLLAFPIIASMVSRTAMGFVDFAMISQLGIEAQAAFMPANILVFCVISLGMGTVTAISTLVSQSLGQKNYRECSAYNWQGFYVAAAYSAFFLPLYFLLPYFFHHVVKHEPAVQEMEIIYSQICILGLFPSIASASLSNFFNGVHRPNIGLWVALVGNLFNLVANWALIFGHLGFPALGMAGSAWGTFAATVLQTLILFAWTLLPSYHTQFQTRHTFQIDWVKIWQIIKVGFPAGLQFVSDIVAFTIFTLFLVGRFGEQQLAASNLVFQFLQISFMPTVGLSIAVTAMVGKAIGQQRPDYARLVTRWATLFALGYMGAIGLCYVTLRYPLVGLLSQDPVVIQHAVTVLLLCALFQLFDALGIIHVGALRGAGDNLFPALTSVLVASTVFIPGGYLIAYLQPAWGITGPWIAATSFIILVGLIATARWKWGPWEKIDLFKKP